MQREMRAAGMGGGRYRQKKRRGINYNEDIPFEKKPRPGFFYDNSVESADLVDPN